MAELDVENAPAKQHKQSDDWKAKVLLASTIAASLETITMYPLDVLKTRSQLQYPNTKNTVRYKAPKSGPSMWRLLRDEGLKSPFRGLMPTTLGLIPLLAVRSVATDPLKQLFVHTEDPSNNVLDSAGGIGRLAMCGALLGVAESFVLTPMEAVKIGMQAEPRTETSRYQGMRDTFSKLWNSGPFPRNLFRGHSLTMARQSVYGATALTTHDCILKWFCQDGRAISGLSFFTAGVAASAAAAVVGAPFDTVKTRVQNGDVQWMNIKEGFPRILNEEGVRGLFKGLPHRLTAVTIGSAIASFTFEIAFRYFEGDKIGSEAVGAGQQPLVQDGGRFT